VALPGSGEEVTLLPRLHLLPLKGYGREEKKVTSLLGPRFALEPDPRTELEVACLASGRTPGDYSSEFRLVLDPESAANEAAKRIHTELLRVMVANVEGILEDWDIEFLHDFRVALRRARSAITQLKGIFPAAAVQPLAEELQWLGTRTGPARDLDVYLLKIPEYRSALHARTQEELEPLIRLLEEKRRREHRGLRACLRSKRFRLLLEDWQAFLDGPSASETELPHAHRPIREVASEQILRAFSRAVAKGERIGPKAAAKALHRLRIDCKKLRYLMTFFQSLYPRDALTVLIKELKLLQDHLGDFNDAQVQREALRRFADELLATGAGPPATLMAMGQLMGQMEGTQARERNSFQEAFARFSRVENRERFQALFGPPPGTEPKTQGEETP
jgi:CHAD domain-containing protein